MKFFCFLYYYIYMYIIEKYIFNNFINFPIIDLIIITFLVKKDKNTMINNLIFIEKLLGEYPYLKKIKKNKLYIFQIYLRNKKINNFILYLLTYLNKNLNIKLNKNNNIIRNKNFNYNIINYKVNLKNIFENFNNFNYNNIYFYILMKKKIKNINLYNNFFKIFFKI